MKKENSNTKTILDMVFEKRNKSYGAYAIRQAYPLTLMKSLMGTLSFFVLACFSVYLYIKKDHSINSGKQDENIAMKYPVFTVKPIDLTPAIDEIKKQKNDKPQKKESVTTTITDESKKEQTSATNSNADERTQNGETKTENTSTNSDPCTNCDVINVKKPTEDKIEFVADIMPEFPGGVNALMKFITSNLIYPEKARILEMEGTVVVNFVVDEEGKITNVKFLKSLGGGCEQEVERVLKLMPLWKPGKSGGKNVKVYYNLPVRFRFQ